jgi:hypothetical protein
MVVVVPTVEYLWTGTEAPHEKKTTSGMEHPTFWRVTMSVLFLIMGTWLTRALLPSLQKPWMMQRVLP